MTHIYGIKNCGSVKKALQFFDMHSLPYTFHDFKISPVSRVKIESWLKKSDMSVLLNTKGTTYRTLGIKALNLDESGKIEWMSNHNLLLKRPIIEYNDKLVVGYDQSHYEGIFHS
ncbi:MAG: arsenate reductase family protein [Sulfuricurvum sp.]|uniref:arsenate reductase family protein n=1 Tax=Sulfuricurvum sp. TaxID=2025608 RepID=UPI002606E933|nr:arsenate reductase family protein [Sulfuricurvum sp.]MDD2368222.1 arsenate reductase family protein [Sulfuricurvum sp.]MDD5117405.1 arsenate reductase family protein [Sulfuricurvum sp.]